MGETMEQRQKSCEERIDSHYDHRIGEIRRLAGEDLIEAADLEDEGLDPADFYEYEPDEGQEPEIDQERAQEELRDRFYESILSVDRSIKVRVCFSWGGPADYIDLYIDPVEREIYRAVYVFQDWFDGAEREIRGTDLDAVLSMFDYLCHE